MSLYNTFKTDTSREREGIDIEYGTADNGKPILIRIARAGGGNERFSKTFEQKIKPYRKQIQTETLDEKISKRIMIETFAETVVLGWANVQDADGEYLEYTRDNVIALFIDLPDLFDDIREMSNKSSLFREALREEDSKNSKTSSPTA